MSEKFIDRRRKYRNLTKQQLLNIADEIKYRRFADGRITGIDIFKRKALIHQSTAYYTTISNQPQLTRVTGKFQEEIFHSWIKPMSMQDKGFIYTKTEEINKKQTVTAGTTGYLSLYSPESDVFIELLSMAMQLDQTPASAPAILTNTNINGTLYRGIARELTLGDAVNFYELDLSSKRIWAYKIGNLDQRFRAKLTAKATTDTVFEIRGLIAKYVV